MTQAEQQAAAYKIWAEKHGKLAKKVLAKKTKQAGRAALKNVLDPQPKNAYRGNGAPGAQSLTIKSTESKASKSKPTPTSSKSKPTPTSSKSKPTPPVAKPSAAKPTNKGDGSVKAINKQTTFEQQQQYQASRKNRKGEERISKDAKGNTIRQRWDGEKWVTKKVKGKG